MNEREQADCTAAFCARGLHDRCGFGNAGTRIGDAIRGDVCFVDVFLAGLLVPYVKVRYLVAGAEGVVQSDFGECLLVSADHAACISRIGHAGADDLGDGLRQGVFRAALRGNADLASFAFEQVDELCS